VREYPTILEVFQAAANAQGAKRAVVALSPHGTDYDEISYRALAELADRVATGLVRRGVQPQEKVAILSRPRPEWAAAFLGILQAGAVAVPIDPLLKEAEIQRLVQACDITGVIASGDLFALVEGLSALRFVAHLDAEGDLSGSEGACSWEELLAEPHAPTRERSPRDIAVMLCTSGTTGDAKSVMLAHENITANLSAVFERLDVNSRDVVLSIAPWNHSFGLAVLIAALWKGATIVYTTDYANLAEVLRRYETTILVGVPKLYHAMYQRVEDAIRQSFWKRALRRVAPQAVGWMLKRKLAGGKLRFFLSGSAPLSPATIQGFRQLGVGMIEGYGMTEASPVLSFSTPFNCKAGSVGPALSNVEFKIIEPNDEGVGELLARGPNIMRGYYKNPQRTNEVIDEEGWLHTGDLAHLDDDGWLYIKGRRKNVIVLDTGKNVYPEEIEWELGRIPYVEDVMVRSSERKGIEVIQALVYPKWDVLGSKRSTNEIKRLIWEEIKVRNQNLASYKRIKSEQDVIIVEQPFEKTTLKDIKRYLYTQAPVGGAESGR
jgi:long-chain acyl-CoA synthetase